MVRVCVTVAVTGDDPYIGLTVAVSDVRSNLKEFGTSTVDDACTHNVTGLVNFCDNAVDGFKSVGTEFSKSTIIDDS